MATHRISIAPDDFDRDAVAHALHAAGPVTPVDLGGVDALAITHHDALRTVLADRTDTYVRGNAPHHWRALREGDVDPTSPLVRLLSGSIGSLLTSHGAAHARLRKPLQTHFTRRRVEELRPLVEDLTTSLLDDLDGRERVDLKEDFAWPLTVGVLVHLLGVDRSDAPVLGDLARRIFQLTDTEVFADTHRFLAALLEQRRLEPGHDLVSALAKTDDEAEGDDHLGDAQVVANLFLLVAAGFETTMGTLANGIRALLEHPDQLRRLTGQEVTWGSGVEEILRRHSSVSLLPGVFTTRETELAGVTVPEGELLLLAFAAAGLDRTSWDGPDTFDVGRDARGHLGFGHGPHLCLGAPLARLELTVALPTLFARFPRLELEPAQSEVTPVRSWMMRHDEHLWVRTAAARSPLPEDTPV
ncbi:cytochrome P450 [Nocardiopsis sp. HNM0947]|uniref:Cytochrome P450 n=1 Tax=Nocardiopsis coralli TaxID=2772213 RepID=A0ABR9PA58_9ACTN|nr:cytochrome P450 [Nocardiopsis coralli]MBE3000731.1 cytochrome P450 [Nocardiopsis coralli]